MKPADIGSIRTPSDPQLHPDGERVAFVVTRMDLEHDSYERQIWVWDGSEANAITSGYADSRPRWSPDGERLAFLRAERATPTLRQLALVDQETVSMTTDFSLGVREAEWSPDGSALAVVAIEWTDELSSLDDDERRRRPARMTRAVWQRDNEDPAHDRRHNVYLVDNGNTRRLTDGRYHEKELAWHPAGDRLAFLSMRHERAGIEPGLQAWEQSTDGGDAAALTDVGAWGWVGYSPDGVPHLIGLADSWDWPAMSRYYRVTDGKLIDLTGSLDRDPLPYSAKIAPPGAQWLDDGFASLIEHEGGVRLLRFDGAGSSTDIVGGDRVITGATLTSDGNRAAFTATSYTDPGELYLWSDGEERRVTGLNDEFRAGTGLIEPERFAFENDGVDIQAWAYLPPGQHQVPLLLNIHGGPASQYGYGFFDEFQAYAGAGYGVVACNPRGSSGRGSEFASAIVGEWMEEIPPDIRDLQACVAAALEGFPRLDADRMGVMGGSYGGFATARLTAVDHRFRSAIVERALTAFPSFAGASDIGPWFGSIYLGPRYPDGNEEAWRASPVAFANRITTPTLVIHSTDDWRCPIDQGQQLFTQLAAQGVPCEMLVFPGEGHELSRSGKPRHRVERLEAVLDWHGRYL